MHYGRHLAAARSDIPDRRGTSSHEGFFITCCHEQTWNLHATLVFLFVVILSTFRFAWHRLKPLYIENRALHCNLAEARDRVTRREGYHASADRNKAQYSAVARRTASRWRLKEPRGAMASFNYVVTAHKSTAVTHSVVGNFTSPSDINLITA